MPRTPLPRRREGDLSSQPFIPVGAQPLLLGLPYSWWLAVGVPRVYPALKTDVDVCTAQDPENIHPSLWAGNTSFGKRARQKLSQSPLCGSPRHLLWRPISVLDLNFILKVVYEENGSWSPLLCAFLTAAAHTICPSAPPAGWRQGSSWLPWVLLVSAPSWLEAGVLVAAMGAARQRPQLAGGWGPRGRHGCCLRGVQHGASSQMKTGCPRGPALKTLP